MGIKRETLEFVEKAKEYFENNIEGSTYSDKENGYIALRWGIMDDCIKVYELGEEVGFFENWCERYSDKDKINYLIDKLANEALDIKEEDICKLLGKIKTYNNKINLNVFKEDDISDDEIFIVTYKRDKWITNIFKDKIKAEDCYNRIKEFTDLVYFK